MKTKQLVNFLNRRFPFKKAAAWDKVGLQFGDLNKKIHGVVVALDLTKEVFDQAIATHSQMIITHHPFLFFEQLEDDLASAPYKRDLIDRIQNTGMAVLAMHTNYDFAKKGMSAQIARKLQLKQYPHQGSFGAFFHHDIRIKGLNDLLKKTFDLEITQTNIVQDKVFKKWAILPGSGGPENIITMAKSGAELIITADIKWSTWVMAQEENIQLVQISHWIENAFTSHIDKIIKRNFPNIASHQVNISKK